MPEARGDTQDLSALLGKLDGKGYGRYSELVGSWDLAGAECVIRRVQADPFAPPTRLAVTVPAGMAALPDELHDTEPRARGLGSFLLRGLRRHLGGDGFKVDAGGQEILQRSAVSISGGAVRVQLGINLPGKGRRIAGHRCAELLTRSLPGAVQRSLRWEHIDQQAARRFARTVEDAEALRAQLTEHGLVSFVPDGAVLARRSGIDDRPLADALAFSSPPSLRTTLQAPNEGPLPGMGVPEGVTLIVGGGYHGKSTLLRAIEAGVYDHVPGDGREAVVTRADAISIRAEDNRSVERVDVAAFVSELPSGPPTDDFSTSNASGSTSQAASTIEAVEAGAGALLIDEDTSATNLMIRDSRMQRLIPRGREPLVPFVERIRPLWQDRGISTVLVMGGSGDYLAVADTVLMMDAYRPSEVTARAHELGSTNGERAVEHSGFPEIAQRVHDPGSISPQVKGKRKITARGSDRLSFGSEDIDLAAVEQIADPSQVTGIGLALSHLIEAGLLDGRRTLAEALAALRAELVECGGQTIAHGYAGDFAVPRPLEVAAALNRLRSARVQGLRRGAPPAGPC
jgi:predicted ABC-class ATPase